MRAFCHALLLCGLSAIFAGCAGVGIFALSDPAAKLRDAGDLFDRQDRPLIAERLIREAIGSYRKNNDQLGLADAYRTYGFFFRSSAMEGKWSKYYRENGFLDKSASYDARYEKSIEYLEKARAIFAEHKRYDVLTNVNLNIGFTYEVMGYGAAACEAFDRSLENNRDNLRQIPKAKIALPQGFATFEEFLAPHRERAGCVARHNHPLRKHVVQAA
jgi:tetratricopeptide (TPR) repeat protein